MSAGDPSGIGVNFTWMIRLLGVIGDYQLKPEFGCLFGFIRRAVCVARTFPVACFSVSHTWLFFGM
jgi:hypothetical protein